MARQVAALSTSCKRYFLLYSQELTGIETTSVRRLATAAQEEAPSAAEAVFLYALAASRLELLLRCATHGQAAEGWSQAAKALPDEVAVEDLVADPCGWGLGERYVKSLASCRHAMEAPARRAALARRYRKLVLSLLNETGTSVSSLCRESGANKGNVAAWLRGQDGKVSLDLARHLHALLRDKARGGGRSSTRPIGEVVAAACACGDCAVLSSRRQATSGVATEERHGAG